MNCLSRDSLIMTKEGLKKITAIKKGEKIFAFNQKNQTPVLKKCTGIFNNGVKKIYELATLHYSIKATSNHPFLVLKRNGRGKKSHFIWKTLGKLKKGDEVVVQNSNLIKGQSFKFKPIKVSKKGDYKVNRINNVKLPKQSSPGLMEILGLYVGDGWIRVKKGEVGFALPRETKGSKRLIKLYKKLFGKDIIQKEKNYIHIYSVNLARFIKSLNFGTNAKTKIVPPWIFTLPTNEKEAFVKGLMLSDGYKINNSCRYVSASIDLLKSLRILLQSIDYRVGKIHKQTKTKGTFCVYRKLLEDSYYGYICFSKKSKPNISKYLSQTKQRDFLADNEKFSTEKIKSIKFIREEPTLDLRVEGEHNFIADGFVVHNTGNQRSSATPFGAATTTTPTGKVKQGKEQFHKDITKIVAAHNIPYVAQASPHNWQDLYNKAKKAFEIKGPAFINVLSPCQLNWKFPMEQTIKIAELATETNFWPLYEIENGKYKINYKPENPKPIEEFLKLQKRFKHLFKEENKHILKQIQENVNKEWQKLLALASEK
ncbi:MAG: thiamine pyrophosphate-dependent enzyme [Nanoarchaeota archaeon]|nr:thiamine pyrophosphate-dependent enzyme [Nanoarchaeota archaeon]